MIASVRLHVHVMPRFRTGIEGYCECSHKVFRCATLEDTLICVGVFLPCEPLLDAGWITDSICGPVRFYTARGPCHSNPDGVREEKTCLEMEMTLCPYAVDQQV
jgi:hypothetical protein